MTLFRGTFQAPPFGPDDLDEIETRDEKEYTGVGRAQLDKALLDMGILCDALRSESPLREDTWHAMREEARALPDEAQQLKTDLYRLLKVVKAGV